MLDDYSRFKIISKYYIKDCREIMRESACSRPEIEEALLSESKLESLWRFQIRTIPDKFNAIETVPTLIDFVRGANLRALLAKKRGLSNWEEIWYRVKHFSLVKALEMRASGVGEIYVEQEPSLDGTCVNSEGKVLFVFDSSPEPYRTQTDFVNLTRIKPKDELMGLIVNFDGHIKRRPRGSRRFNFAGLLS